MDDIVENSEIDKDIIDPSDIEETFSITYSLADEKLVSSNKPYISKVCRNRSSQIALTISNKSIQVYNVGNSSLSKECALSGHGKGTTDIVFSPRDGHVLYSCGSDGVVKMWDTRASGSCSQEYKDENESEMKPFDCMDVSCNGRVLCAGSQLVQDDAFLVFWDQRQTKPLGGYWNSHTDDITQVRFHKEKSELVVSTALDGLLNVYNIMEPNEDDALTYSLNAENSIERVSWVDANTVSCVTQANDLHLWNVDTGDLLVAYGKDKVAKAIKRSREDDCYLVDSFTTSDNQRFLLAGSNGGDGTCLRSVTIGEKKLYPRTNFTNNKQTVLCSSYDSINDRIITGGEEGFLSLWKRSENNQQNKQSHKITKHMKKLNVRHKPY